VATPGRLLSHLENAAGLPDLCHNLRTLVLDEADQLHEQARRQSAAALHCTRFLT
jgi:superfamily II DNA/RNA helicase